MSRFTSHLGLTAREDDDGRPLLRDGRTTWCLSEPLTYDVGAEGSGESITVPAGVVTDLASIPRFANNIFPADGPWAKAAVVHDALYASRGTMLYSGRRFMTRVLPYSRAEADGILREAMCVLGVGAWERSVIWAAVRVGGGPGWGAA